MAQYDLKPYLTYLTEHLSKKRLNHSKNVADACKMLAKRYGGVDPEKAYFAGLVHDICKDSPKEEQYARMMRCTLDVCGAEQRAFKVWHGIAGAVLLQEEFGIDDMDILRAVRFHTVGRKGMSQLEKIVYIGDVISVERNYPDVALMRKKALESLDAGMLCALVESLRKLLRREMEIPHHTVEAYNEALANLHEPNHEKEEQETGSGKFE